MKLRHLIGTLTLALVLAGTSSPALAAEGGDQQFLLVAAGEEDEAQVQANGVFTGFGREKVVEETFEENEDGTFSGTVDTKFIFTQGKLFLDIEFQGSGTFDEETCSGTGSGTATFEITGGTGQFKKATGDGTATFEFAFVDEKNDEGECSEEDGEGVFFAKLVGDLALKGSVNGAAAA